MHNTDISVRRLLWIDMEMTGLDPVYDRILEVAAIVTDLDFKQFATYESAVHQSPEIIANMNDWSKQYHAKNGLIERVKDAPIEQQVEAALISLVRSNFNDEPVVLAGNSIHQDRRFIRRWWPNFDELLHYRMLDVSSFKIIMENKYHLAFDKKKAHSAASDINESIAELKFYLNYFNKE